MYKSVHSTQTRASVSFPIKRKVNLDCTSYLHQSWHIYEYMKPQIKPRVGHSKKLTCRIYVRHWKHYFCFFWWNILQSQQTKSRYLQLASIIQQNISGTLRKFQILKNSRSPGVKIKIQYEISVHIRITSAFFLLLWL